MRREYVVLTIARMYQVRQRLATLTIADPVLAELRHELCTIADTIHNLPRESHADKDRKALASDAEIIAELLLALEEHVLCQYNLLMRKIIIHLANYWGINGDNNVLLFVRGNFAVKHYRFFDSLHRNILELKYHVRLSREIRLVFVPALYDDDLIFSSILFHEVGHMVEREYSIGELLYQKLIAIYKTKRNAKVTRKYFKNVISDRGVVDENKLRAHICEYVSDIFACQYLGEHALHYVTYKEEDNRKAERIDHPTYEEREKLVSEFVAYMNSDTQYTNDEFLKMMIEIYENTDAIDNLGKKYQNIDVTPLLNGQQLSLASESELFSLFYNAWPWAVKEIKELEEVKQLPANSLTVYDYYCLLNDGIEHTIENSLKNIYLDS